MSAAIRPELLSLFAEVTARILEDLTAAAVKAAKAPAAPTRFLDARDAAKLAGVTPRWLRTKTKGMSFRRDVNRKTVLFEESGLKTWLAGGGK